MPSTSIVPKVHFGTAALAFLVAVLSLVIATSGCSKQQTAQSNANEQQDDANEEPATSHTVPVAVGQSPANQYEPALAGEKLVGVWYGVVHLDNTKVMAKLETLKEPEVRAQFMSMAETIESMRIATEFRSDGTMEIDIEIRPAGAEVQRASTVGTWRILEQNANSVMIETTEPAADPNQPELQDLVKQVQYTFIDKNHVAIRAPVSPDFNDCDPAVVFERQDISGQPAERVTGQPDTSVKK